MSQSDTPNERSELASDAALNEAWEQRRQSAHPTAERLWSVALGKTHWSPSETSHIAECAGCQKYIHDVRAAVAALPTTAVAHPSPVAVPAAEAWVISASSEASDDSLYAAVLKAVLSNETALMVKLSDGLQWPLFEIHSAQHYVEPKEVEGRTVLVTLPRLGQQEVTAFGGIPIPFEELRGLRIRELESGAVTISR